jgi:flagellar hook-length control protein FliK
MAAAAAAQLVGSTNEITATAAPTAVAIATPVEAPDFGQALGLQLSVLARDGVHEAELHLNPADMGPVSVQIVMDGTQARIDFGADVAATRQAIEAGLPALASALRDAGFTLAGGGVSQQSQQSQQRGDGSNADGRRGARGGVGADGIRSIDAAARAASTPRRVALGAVDTYA